MRPSRDAVLTGTVVAWIAVVLVAERATAVAGVTAQQVLLGVPTWLLLVALLRRESPLVRAQVGVVVVFATSVEYVFSWWLGVYEYRMGTVPMFVPPGHGLVYLAALSFGRTRFARRHARPLLGAVLVVGGVWALWGLVWSPRPDALGAFWYGCLVLFAWRGRSPLVYVGAFGVVSYLEILGTSLGTWTWGAVDPVLGVVTIGNPPSGIAGGYAWFDAAALAAAPALVAWWSRRRAAVPVDPDEADAHSRRPLREAA
ncbi:MAG: hypothetical protein ACLGIG_08300 [Actinomycetes bacterium]